MRYKDPNGLWIPGVHSVITHEAAIQAGCKKLADRLAEESAKVDDLEDSQLPVNSYWHAMVNGNNNATGRARDIINFHTYVFHNSRSCDVKNIARALHAVQDSHSPSHEGLQPWLGFDSTPYFGSNGLISHLIGDISTNTENYDDALNASREIISNAINRCSCLCN